MIAGHDQDVPLEHRPGVQERYRDIVGQHDLGRSRPGHDAAEQAVTHPTTLACAAAGPG